MNDPAKSAASYVRLSRVFLADPDEPPSLSQLVRKAVETLPMCNAASITLSDAKGRFHTPAASDPLAMTCDQLQYSLGEGPCVTAAAPTGPDACYLPDTRRDTRFPAWGPRVAEHGVRSVLSVRMAEEKGRHAALNFYSRTLDGFSPDEIDLGLVFTTLATNALQASTLITGLSTAMRSRHMIGVAQGILMARYDIPLERAFEVLKRYSNDTNIPVRELARQVVELGRLPEQGAPAGDEGGDPPAAAAQGT
jgi:GAF domain-containing protein